jgi:hypothetical protein
MPEKIVAENEYRWFGNMKRCKLKISALNRNLSSG